MRAVQRRRAACDWLAEDREADRAVSALSDAAWTVAAGLRVSDSSIFSSWSHTCGGGHGN